MIMTKLPMLLSNLLWFANVISAFQVDTVVVSRGVVEPFGFFAAEENLTANCVYDDKIILRHPSSLNESDRFYNLGNAMLKAATITVDRINKDNCGVVVGGRRYAIELHSYSDDSDGDKTAAVTRAIVNQSNFLLAGYSTTLANIQNPIADTSNRISITAGSSGASAHAASRHAFGMLPPSTTYTKNGWLALKAKGAKTAAIVKDDNLVACGEDEAAFHGLELVYYQENAPVNQTYEVLEEAAYQVSLLDPEVVFVCLRGDPADWVKAMRKHDWTPKAVIWGGGGRFGSDDFVERVGSDAQYIMGMASWDKSLPPIKDAITGWVPEEFFDFFQSAAGIPPAYQYVAQSAAISILLQAAVKAGSLDDTDAILEILQTESFSTVYGEVSFDENGQNEASYPLLLQYDMNRTLQLLHPEELRSGNFEMVYPMPTWKNRDCTILSNCTETGGGCGVDGQCTCPEESISKGIGETAHCRLPPLEEDMTYISDGLIHLGWALVVIQGLVSLFLFAWTCRYRETNIVKASQPLFLHMVSFGCCVLSWTIIPASVQGDYRYLQDPETRQETDLLNDQISNADFACMAAPWLFGYGFSIVFSALFAKIYRVRMIVASAVSFRRTRVHVKDVMYIMVGILGGESIILLLWSLISPLTWEREVILGDEYGLTLISSGRCVSDYSLVFLLIFLGFNLFILFYALVLCYLTRTYPSEFAESRWITACVISYMQILLLAVPILAIVEGNNNVAFFGRAAIVFLMSMSASLLVFGPKMYALHYTRSEQDEADLVTRSKIFDRMSAAVSQKNSDRNDATVSGLNQNGNRHSRDSSSSAGMPKNSWAMVGYEDSEFISKSITGSAFFKSSNDSTSDQSTEPPTKRSASISQIEPIEEGRNEQAPSSKRSQSEKVDSSTRSNSANSVDVWVEAASDSKPQRDSASSGADAT
ncbi:unnamed protein product [Cylindrotheca closterium]|uniref:G-protein coupled receptors family 3 profile domain-containing protein n=1 Tax=Cylindrotheca closterium TaxID=2856 RepID=A0AAD2G3D0_9STRA|nr:unnamed protein product [Cylindrotheca closterium]